MDKEYMMKSLIIGLVTGYLMMHATNYPMLCLVIFICGLYMVWHLRELL